MFYILSLDDLGDPPAEHRFAVNESAAGDLWAAQPTSPVIAPPCHPREN